MRSEISSRNVSLCIHNIVNRILYAVGAANVTRRKINLARALNSEAHGAHNVTKLYAKDHSLDCMK